MMKRIILTLLTAVYLSVYACMAQTYMKVNYDTKTVAAISAEYAAAAVAEGYYDEQVKDILAKYGVAEVAAAGIFTSKFLERKSLTDLGIWDSYTENYYYRRVYGLVTAKLIPMMWDVAGDLVKYPHKSLYWGSYLIKICSEVKSLCKQFETVVTNSSLTFSDVQFLEITPALHSFMRVTEFGGVDWNTLMDDFGSVTSNMTLDNLKSDIGTLYNLGTQLASAGLGNLVTDITDKSSFDGTFGQKALAAAQMAKNVYDIYGECDGKIEGLFRNYLGEDPTAADLFSLSSYNLTGWIDDYVNEAANMYYTQRWYIEWTDRGSETVAEYTPPTDDNSILNGSQWVRFETSDPGFYPNSAQLETVLSNSERYAGWSRSKIDELNSRNDGNTYRMSKYLQAYKISKGNKQTKKAYAYKITVTRSWSRSEVVYEENFDSYTMDLNTFKMKMQDMLNEFNENEDGKVYQLRSGPKSYYEVADEVKLKGCESVVITMTCTDDVNLGEGATQYKCRKCGSSLNAHSKECAMVTSLDEDDLLDTSELENAANEYRNRIKVLENEIAALEEDNRRLAGLIASAAEEDIPAYREQMEANNNAIAGKRNEINSLNTDLAEIEAAISEAESDNEENTDDHYRIPAIMEELRQSYKLTWQGDGWWSGYTYYRYATTPNINGTITFKATLSIAKKPKYFLGIKIHRAILKITWGLGASYSDSQVVANIELDPDMNERDKKAIVDAKLSELANEFPSCRFTTEYIKSEPIEEDNTDDTYHLLWASDRLAIARQIETRLMNIYADLVSLKKMMHYKLSIIDVLKDIAPYINTDKGKKQTIAEKCRKRWLHNAAEEMHSNGYNGKYDDEDEQG